MTAALHPDQLQRLRTLAARAGVERLELFGSAARGVAEPHDFDFVVSFREMPPLEHGRAYLRLAAALEAELRAPVDLLEEEAIANPYFLRAIRDERVLIYAR